MNDDFEYYTLKLKTLAPVFVGSGKSISKKEYYYTPKKDIIRFFDTIFLGFWIPFSFNY